MSRAGTTRVSIGAGESLVQDLGDVVTSGPSGAVWALDSPQLNANLVSLEAGGVMADHVNHEVDVFLVVSGGRGRVRIHDVEHDIVADSVVLIPRGMRRSIHADSALVYFSIHARRDGLQVTPRQ